MNNDTLRKRNRGLILRLVATGECLTRADLVERTGLTKMSVSNAVGDLVQAGYLKECSCVERKGQGRNPVALALSGDSPYLVGVYLFRDECKAILCDLRLQPVKVAGVPIDAERAAHLDQTLAEVVDAVMPADRSRVLGIGVGSIGPVDVEKGVLLDPPNFYGVHDVDVCGILGERYGMPVALDNHYDCAAMAERWFGDARAFDDFILVGFSNGVGSGVVMGGEVVHGASGLTSEIGHICIDFHGPECGCGRRGCLEAYVKTPVLERRIAEACGEELTLEEACLRWQEATAAGEEHPTAQAALLDAVADEVACALTSAVNVLNPQAVLLAHDAVLWPDELVEAISERVNKWRIASDPVVVTRSVAGREEHALSSAAPMLRRVFDGEFL